MQPTPKTTGTAKELLSRKILLKTRTAERIEQTEIIGSSDFGSQLE
jgi:hypothetical protein